MRRLGILLIAVGLVGSIVLYDIKVPLYLEVNEIVPGSDVILHDATFYLSASLPMFYIFIGGIVLYLTARRSARNQHNPDPLGTRCKQAVEKGGPL
jgi:hypothetical protein